VTFVDDDEIEEIGRDIFEDLVFFGGTREGLVKAEIDFVGWIDLAVLDLRHDRAKRLEIVYESLIGENVSVHEEEGAFGLLGLPEPPDDLEGGVGFSCAGSHYQEEAVLPFSDGLENTVDRFDLVVTGLFPVGVLVVWLKDEFFFGVLNVSVLFVAIPQFVRRGE
jgi:hypothetical protein